MSVARELRWPTLVALLVAGVLAGPALARQAATWAQLSLGAMVQQTVGESLAAPASREAEPAQPSAPPSVRAART